MAANSASFDPTAAVRPSYATYKIRSPYLRSLTEGKGPSFEPPQSPQYSQRSLLQPLYSPISSRDPFQGSLRGHRGPLGSQAFPGHRLGLRRLLAQRSGPWGSQEGCQELPIVLFQIPTTAAVSYTSNKPQIQAGQGREKTAMFFFFSGFWFGEDSSGFRRQFCLSVCMVAAKVELDSYMT